MAKKNYYAVKVGLTPGIYKTWDECKDNTTGVSGAKYQGFMTYEEALAYMGNTSFIEGKQLAPKKTASTNEDYAFVDGSYDSQAHVYGFGGYVMVNGEKHFIQGSGADAEMATMHNVAGEILGCMSAVKKAIDLGVKELTIYYDYQGIEMWATNKWKRNKQGTIAYYEYMQEAQQQIKLNFVHVKGHTGIEGNEEADKLAKEAVAQGIASMNNEKMTAEQNFTNDLHSMRDADSSSIIRPCDILADMHTHTIFSGHAFSTLKENIEAAAQAGLKYIVTSDHYYKDGTELDQKNEFNRIAYVSQRANPNRFGVHVIGSVECNLEQNLRPDLAKKMQNGEIKYRPIGFHSWFVPREERVVDEILDDFKKAHEEMNFNVFVHIERELDKICHGIYGASMAPDLEYFFNELIDYAKKNNVLLEVNEASLAQDNSGNRERMRYWLEVAKKNGNEIVLGTDAHYCDEVGRFDNVIAMLNEVGYPKELIVNCNENRIRQFV